MNKKNAVGVIFFAGFLALIVSGMVYLQPEKQKVEQEMVYELRGFPVIASEVK